MEEIGRQSATLSLTCQAPILTQVQMLSVTSSDTYPARINFTIATLTFKILTLEQPDSLTPLLHRFATARTLRSSSQNLLQQRKVRTEMASRASVTQRLPCGTCLPREITDDLSITLDTFKRRLKFYILNCFTACRIRDSPRLRFDHFLNCRHMTRYKFV
jgi:hypothetical protein